MEARRALMISPGSKGLNNVEIVEVFKLAQILKKLKQPFVVDVASAESQVRDIRRFGRLGL